MASSYGYIKQGATGDTVKWIQEQLGINADGVFGSQTKQAVRDFQKANGIQVDGIVGNETMEYLLGKSKNSAASSPDNSTADWLASYTNNKPTYSQSQAVIDAANQLSQYEGNRPGAYTSSYAAQIQGMLDQIMNREKFSYDFATDPVYQQYADRYQQQGKLAMMDTMGQAAALTGGYGNSYAQNVGQQAYQGHLQALNDVIPELRAAAYQMYQDEGNQMLQQMSILQGLEDTEYGRYRDTVSDFYTDRDYYYGKYNDLSDDDYNRYLNDLASWQDDRNFAYQQQQDRQAQANWEAEFAFAKDQAAAKSSGSSSGSRSSGGGSGSNNSSNPLDALLAGAIDPSADAPDKEESLADMAYDYRQNNPSITLDSRTLDYWLDDHGISGDDAQTFKAYLKHYGATTSRR